MEQRKARDSRPNSRFFKAVAMGTFVMTAVALSQENNIEALNRVIHAHLQQTDLEKTTSSIVSEAVGDDVRVNCDLDPYASGLDPNTKGYVQPFAALGNTYTPSVMTLTESICTSIDSIKVNH